MKRPRIVLSTGTRLKPESRRLESVCGLDYAEAVTRAGGLPLLLPILEPELAEACLEGADGLLLSGGGDADPVHFGQEPHPHLGIVDERRDAFEFALYRAARRRALPVLGVCRGLQMINIAEGGTLHQHLGALPDTLQHDQRSGDGGLLHGLRLEPGSLLAARWGCERVRVNSYHHQAADRVGSGLRAVAWSADGVIEALEGAEGGFVLGVQWHPELSFARHPEQLAPLSLLVEAAQGTLLSARALAV